MPGPQHTRMIRDQLTKLVNTYASATYPLDMRDRAVRAVLSFHSLQTSKLDEAAFDASVVAVAAKMAVTMPSVPADLSKLSDAELVALADSLWLAQEDYRQRDNAMNYCDAFWRERGVVPTANQYLSMFLRIANYLRAAYGLSAVA